MKTATATFAILGVIIGAAVLVLAFLYLQQKQAYEDLEQRTFALEEALAAQLEPEQALVYQYEQQRLFNWQERE
jgi:hypothetical protein